MSTVMTLTTTPVAGPPPEITNAATRREFLGMLAVAGLLTGCTSDGEDADPAPTVRIEHAGGVTEVPANVSRIATVDGFVDLQALLAFEIQPVATGGPEDYLDQPFIAERLGEDAARVGAFGQQDLEAVVAAEPDLILSAEYDVERYDLLSGIAPTVLLDRGLDDKDQIRLVGRILGREDKANEILDDLREREAEVAAVIAGSALATDTIGILASHGSTGTVRTFDARSRSGRELTALGVADIVNTGGRPQSNSPTFTAGQDISTEELSRLSPAELLILLVVDTSTQNRAVEVLVENQLWSTLPAVQAGRVFEASFSTWFGGGYLHRLQRVDDYERIARESTPSE